MAPRRPFLGIAASAALLSLASVITEAKTPSRKELQRIASAHAAKGEFEKAEAALQECLALKADDQDCKDLLGVVRQNHAAAIYRELQATSRFDLHRRKALVETALKATPSALWAQEFWTQNEAALTRVVIDAKSYCEAAAAGTPPSPDRLKQFPPPLQAYVPFVPELGQVQRDAIERAARAVVDAALAAGEYRRAFETLDSIGGDATAKLQGLSAEASKRLTGDIAQATAAGDLASLALTMQRLEEIRRWLDPEAVRNLQQQADEAAAPLLTRAVPQGFRGQGSAAARVVLEAVLGGATRLGDPERLPWRELTGAPPMEPARLIAGSVPADCLGEVDTSRLATKLAQMAPPVLRLTQGQGSLELELAEVTCRVGTETRDSQEVPSTYVASYQQIQNPDYVQLQTQLQIALADMAQAAAAYAANPNFGTGCPASTILAGARQLDLPVSVR